MGEDNYTDMAQARNQRPTDGLGDQIAQQQQAVQASAIRGAVAVKLSPPNRMVHITFAGNGYIVNEHLQGPYETVPSGKPFMVFTTTAALLAYLTEQLVGGPGSAVLTPVDPEQAGLDLGPIPDKSGDHFELDESDLEIKVCDGCRTVPCRCPTAE